MATLTETYEDENGNIIQDIAIEDLNSIKLETKNNYVDKNIIFNVNIEGNFIHCYTGTSLPSNTLGNNGDLFFLVEG